MNLLPFVLIVVVILSLFSLSHFENAIVQKKETQVYLAYFKGLREARNEKASLAYKKSAPKKLKPPKPLSPSSAKKPLKTYFRKARIGWDKGRLNLSSLILHPDNYPLLKKVFASYVKELYGHAEFFPNQDRFAEDLLHALIEYYKKKELSTPFYLVPFNQKPFESIFYKMVRGTHTYDLEKKVGYPPFGELFTFEKSERPPMNFHYANPSFLSIVLGKELQKDFIELEKKRLETAKKKSQSPIKKSEFEALLERENIEEKESLVSLFDFNYQSSASHSEKYRDPETQLTVKVH